MYASVVIKYINVGNYKLHALLAKTEPSKRQTFSTDESKAPQLWLFSDWIGSSSLPDLNDRGLRSKGSYHNCMTLLP